MENTAHAQTQARSLCSLLPTLRFTIPHHGHDTRHASSVELIPPLLSTVFLNFTYHVEHEITITQGVAFAPASLIPEEEKLRDTQCSRNGQLWQSHGTLHSLLVQSLSKFTVPVSARHGMSPLDRYQLPSEELRPLPVAHQPYHPTAMGLHNVRRMSLGNPAARARHHHSSP